MYTLLGRVLLSLFVDPDSSNYIWRFFCRITDPFVAVVALVTPKAAAPVVVWLFGFVWLFWLRVLLLYVFLLCGCGPAHRLSRAMDRNLYYIGIAFFGMVNGIFNPLMAFAYVFSKVLMDVPLFGSESLFFYFAALMLSTATIILGGIPAAHLRALRRRQGRLDRSLAVDLARRHRHPDASRPSAIS